MRDKVCVEAFHTVWTRPTNLQGDFFMQDYDLLVTCLSALNWKKSNGNITLFADKFALSYFDSMGMLGLWDYANELPYDLGISPNMYWAGAKLFALKKMQAPVVMLDTDMIVWQRLENLKESRLWAAHSEPLMPNVYKPKEYFQLEKPFPMEDFSFQVCASNTAILYIGDEEFKNYYCDTAIDFMKSTKDVQDTLGYMVFAEQRLLSMCAYKEEKNIRYLIEFPEAIGNQDQFTHLWGYKRILYENSNERLKFCKRCVKRLQKDFFAETKDILANPLFEGYV